ncbi:T9SS type A sorting domain-containing protein [Flavobacterium sp. TP390]|uniref:T9SS type A sorting domain-containing protein n=1 Tax=Flavobacterium profundi TaxID=1774945 RepID=A0A6I4IW26_9FLAO|nr:T9SS type A sorting domain-containing protein [Flavobacterium profundi]MVO11030.1 T9SS type A sorting domain-containing protein [Flavobacterium profundi]
MKINYILFLIFFKSLLAIAQAPNISYPTPNIFSVNETITPLLPTNAGGSIPNGYGIITYAGTGLQGDTVGDRTTAQFNFPTTAILDHNNAILVVDRGNHKIKKIDSNGLVSNLVGSGVMGSLDGPAEIATFNFPSSIVEDSNGNLFICDQSNHKIRKVDTNGIVSTFAGSGVGGFQDGVGTAAKFYYPDEITIDSEDNIYVADYYNHRIRKITPLGVVSTLAGSVIGNLDGIGSQARFNSPTGVCLDGLGNIIVTDYGNHRIKKILPSGQVITIAGNGSGDINGDVAVAKFKNPTISTIDVSGTLFVTDYGNNKIKIIDTTGTVSTFCGSGALGDHDDELLLAKLKNPSSIAIDETGTLYITDYGNHKIKKTTYYDFNYTISPSLPTGLIFNSATGAISGTPATVSPPTDYTVTISNTEGTSSFVLNIEVGALSTTEFQKNIIQIYPNPIQDFLNVKAKSTITKVEIYTLLGQLIQKMIPNQEVFQINFSEIEKGIYILKLESNFTNSTIRVVKQE